MAEKLVLLADPGIDGAFAVSLALLDPDVDVLGVGAVPGNVSAAQATRNVQIVVEQVDPPRWPRLGEAPDVAYPIDGRSLHGPTGLGATEFPSVSRHNLLPSEKLVVELVRQHPREVTLVCLGPATAIARAIDLSPDLPGLVKRIVLLGGSHREPGNAGPVSEFHFFCDPAAARATLHCGAAITLVPLDCMRRVLFSPKDLLDLPEDAAKAGRFLRQIVPFGIAATANAYGIEGFHLKDVLGIAAAARKSLIETKPFSVDVETRGDLTRGMTVFDERVWRVPAPNVDVAVHVDSQGIRDYLDQVLRFRS